MTSSGSKSRTKPRACLTAASMRTRALRRDAVEAAHLRELAAPHNRSRHTTPRPQHPDPGLLRLAAALDHLPVLLLGQRSEILARNTLLQAVLGRPMAPGSSLMDYLFRDPLARERILNWSEFGAWSVAAMRMEVGWRSEDEHLRTMVQDLRRKDPDVARWWNDHTVRDYASMAKTIRHPEGGILEFDIEIVTAPHLPDQHLVVYTTQAYSSTASILPLLVGGSTGATPRPLTVLGGASVRQGTVRSLLGPVQITQITV